jgi:hypothetical protein
MVQELASSQSSVFGVLMQPVSLHVSVVHGLSSLQLTGVDAHSPSEQTPASVQTSPSSQALPIKGMGSVTQAHADTLHVATTQEWMFRCSHSSSIVQPASTSSPPQSPSLHTS